MSKPWYEAQIVGVSIGAILGFLLSYVPQKIDEVRLRSKLKKALKADIREIVASAKPALDKITESMEALKKNKKAAIYPANIGTSIVYEANISNIGILNKDSVETLVEFYSLVEKTKSILFTTSEVLEKFNTKTVTVIDRDFVLQGHTSLIQMYTQIMEDGPLLIKKL
ncbi:hypothetical protein [Desulfobacter postgatei]|uniref:hypothetical protein n=1 Tax=Desulfobacter postgatei TaxID=2293 RepID=UPI00259B63A4|nr:hypothetical protein [uncultured Desulfobacter sp.]